MTAFKEMFKVEYKLAMRQLDVPIFGIIFPLLVAVVLGLVYGKDNTEMMSQTFVSAGVIGITANGLMGLPLTLSGYRSSKILKQLKVTPVSSAMVLLVQFAVKLVISVLSTVLVWLVMKVFFSFSMAGNILYFAVSYLLVVVAIFGIGMVIASVSPNMNTTGLLCSIVYFPMLFLSGATIPLHILPKVLVNILQVLPLTQGINLLGAVAGGAASGVLLPVAVLVIIGAISAVVSVKTFRWE